MNEVAKDMMVCNWDEIVKRVCEPLNLDDVGVSYAVARWRQHAEKVRDVEDAGEVAHSFAAEEVLEAVIAFFRADIAENLAIFRAKLARNDRHLRLMTLRAILGESQGVFVDEDDGERIVPELLSVRRTSKLAKTKMLRQVVQASMALAEHSGDESAEQPSWPTGLGDGILDFAGDLRVFLDEAGERGRQMVTHVCTDTDYAKRIRDDDDMPRCISFLAQIVAETNSNVCLPGKECKIGFASR